MNEDCLKFYTSFISVFSFTALVPQPCLWPGIFVFEVQSNNACVLYRPMAANNDLCLLSAGIFYWRNVDSFSKVHSTESLSPLYLNHGIYKAISMLNQRLCFFIRVCGWVWICMFEQCWPVSCYNLKPKTFPLKAF